MVGTHLRIESSKAYCGLGLVPALGPVGAVGPVVGELDGDGDRLGEGETDGLGEALGSGEALGLGETEGEGLSDTMGDADGDGETSAKATAADSCPPIMKPTSRVEMIFLYFTVPPVCPSKLINDVCG
jgi:hypothetical protein